MSFMIEALKACKIMVQGVNTFMLVGAQVESALVNAEHAYASLKAGNIAVKDENGAVVAHPNYEDAINKAALGITVGVAATKSIMQQAKDVFKGTQSAKQPTADEIAAKAQADADAAEMAKMEAEEKAQADADAAAKAAKK